MLVYLVYNVKHLFFTVLSFFSSILLFLSSALSYVSVFLSRCLFVLCFVVYLLSLSHPLSFLYYCPPLLPP